MGRLKIVQIQELVLVVMCSSSDVQESTFAERLPAAYTMGP